MERAAKQASVRESIHDLKVLDRAPAKAGTGSFWHSLRTFAVGRPLGLLYVDEFGRRRWPRAFLLDIPMMCYACLVLSAFGTNTLISDPKHAYASE